MPKINSRLVSVVRSYRMYLVGLPVELGTLWTATLRKQPCVSSLADFLVRTYRKAAVKEKNLNYKILKMLSRVALRPQGAMLFAQITRQFSSSSQVRKHCFNCLEDVVINYVVNVETFFTGIVTIKHSFASLIQLLVSYR